MKRTQEDLNEKLDMQIFSARRLFETALAENYCSNMRRQYAYELATRLRVLLYDAKTKSLLTELSIKDKLLFSALFARRNVDNANLLADYYLLTFNISSDGYICMPEMDFHTNPFKITFDLWWNEIVIDTKGKANLIATRRDIILTLADKEGGAHVDVDYDSSYYEVQYLKGFKFVDSFGQEHNCNNDYYVESLFVIAKEFFEAYDLYLKIKEYKSSYSWLDLVAVSAIYNKSAESSFRIKRKYILQRRTFDGTLILAYDNFRPANYMLSMFKKVSFKSFRERDILEFIVLTSNDSNSRECYIFRDYTSDKTALLMLFNNKCCVLNSFKDFLKVPDESFNITKGVNYINDTYNCDFAESIRLQGL